MSEYIEIESQPGAGPHETVLTTNLDLAASGSAEFYASPQELEDGSPLAQALSFVEGIRQLHITGQTLTVIREPDAEWHVVIADITAAVRDFFL